jgi:hypothetical protein
MEANIASFILPLVSHGRKQSLGKQSKSKGKQKAMKKTKGSKGSHNK